MSQPKWKFVANLGDVNPLEHGGLFVFIDETGVYPPEMAKVEPPQDTDPEPPEGEEDLFDADEEVKYTVHRAVLEPCTYTNGVLSDNQFHPDSPAWFADKLPAVASFIGVDAAELIGDFTSGDPVKLARAYEAVASYHGWANLDEYPVTLTRKEVKEKYADALRK